MPLKRCQSSGESGWKWGDEGRCYTGEGAKQRAINQALAIGDGEMPEKSVDEGEAMNLIQKILDFVNGDDDVEKGHGFAMFLDRAITQKAEDTGQSQTSIVGEVAQQAGVDETTVFKDVMGDIECPPESRIEAYAEILEMDTDDIRKMAERDGCNYGTQKSNEDDDMTEEADAMVEKEEQSIPVRGSEDASIAFVGASASKLDQVRNKMFTGPVGRTLKDTYLTELDVDEDDIAMMNLVPTFTKTESGDPREPTEEEIVDWFPYFKSELARINPDYVVALGKTASQVLGDIADEWVPHPRAVNIHGPTDEIPRKLGRLKKNIEEGSIDKKDFEYEASDDPDSRDLEADIFKTDDEHQVVKGIVLEPGVEDADGNWTTREQIERTAHDFMKDPRPIFHEHEEELEGAYPVESHITEKDLEINGRTVQEGSWVLGVKVEDENAWNSVKEGDYRGFSIGARAKIAPQLRLSDDMDV